MASGGFDIAKAGWLYRKSSVQQRWKKNWFVLDRDGDLRYFESPDHPRTEERLVVPAVVMAIKIGYDCPQTDLPEGVKSKTCVLELVFRDRESMLLCAELSDEIKAWQIALEEVRTLSPHVAQPGVATATTTIISPPGYVNYCSPNVGYNYPGHVIRNGTILQPPPVQVIQSSPYGTTTVVNASPVQQVVYVNGGPYRPLRYSYNPIYPAPYFFW